MQTGPFHLFWTTGVFYFWALKNQFNFILIVPELFKRQQHFSLIADLPAVKKVVYLPDARLLRKRKFYNVFRALVEEYKPDIALLHNTSFIENQLLIFAIRENYPTCPVVHYQNGRGVVAGELDWQVRKSIQISTVKKRLRILGGSSKFATAIVDLRNIWYLVFNYIIIPITTVTRVLMPPVDPYRGQINKRAMEWTYQPNDCVISYFEVEASEYKRSGVPEVWVAEHPLVSTSEDFFDFFYGGAQVKDQVAIFPSHGFTDSLSVKGFTEREIVERVAGKWMDAIHFLFCRYPDHQFVIKLHPSTDSDVVWTKILAKLKCGFDKLIVVDPQVSAEYLVATSTVVVGDVTTVQWWAALHGEKTVISFDIFGYPSGDEMRYYQPHVWYLTSTSSKSRPPTFVLNRSKPNVLEIITNKLRCNVEQD